MGFVMNKYANRVLVLLAASGLPDKVIGEGITESALLGSEGLMREIHAIRRAQLGAYRVSLSMEDEQTGLFQSDQMRERARVAREITRLLREEAKLSTLSAAEKLLNSLALAKGRHFAGPRPKEGLTSWIQRLLSQVPPSELLHHATKIRKSILRSEEVAWPLKDKGD